MRAAAILFALALPQASLAACRDDVFDGASFTACEVTLGPPTVTPGCER